MQNEGEHSRHFRPCLAFFSNWCVLEQKWKWCSLMGYFVDLGMRVARKCLVRLMENEKKCDHAFSIEFLKYF